MKIISLQIKKFPELWMTTWWADSPNGLSINGTGRCKSDSIENLRGKLEDYRLEVNLRINEALEGLSWHEIVE